MRISTTGSVGVVLVGTILAVMTACGGGSSQNPVNGGGGCGCAASFTPDQPNPSPGTVSMAQGSAAGDAVSIQINLTDFTDVYTVGLDVVYDPAMASFLGHSAGDLAQPNGPMALLVNDEQSGRVVVVASLQGAVPGVDISGTQTLLTLTFKVQQTGQSTLAFQNASLLDSQLDAQEIPATWAGGTLLGN